jgi:hypothetical protein
MAETLLNDVFSPDGTVYFEGVTENGEKFSGMITIKYFNMYKNTVDKKVKQVLIHENGKAIKELHITKIT